MILDLYGYLLADQLDEMTDAMNAARRRAWTGASRVGRGAR
ncbi:hypothetical protein [Blastococcus mobilis]|nr:hypothetical protein [Blastococcus mobilis]